MNILEAIKARVNYPMTDAQAEEKLISRGVDGLSDIYDDFTKSIADSKEFRLAYADCLRFVLTMVNLSQGGSITAADLARIQGTANAIYKQYGEPLVGDKGEEASTITDISYMW